MGRTHGHGHGHPAGSRAMSLFKAGAVLVAGFAAGFLLMEMEVLSSGGLAVGGEADGRAGGGATASLEVASLSDRALEAENELLASQDRLQRLRDLTAGAAAQPQEQPQQQKPWQQQPPPQQQLPPPQVRASGVTFRPVNLPTSGEPSVPAPPAIDASWRPQPGSAAHRLEASLLKYGKVREPVDASRGPAPVDGLARARPQPAERKFGSQVVEFVVREVTSRMKDAGLALLFANCFPNTLDTTVDAFDASAPDAFVITGDIPAQWLRDSTNQVLPYVPFAGEDPQLQGLLCGLVRRQGRDVLVDPYANAFCYADKCKESRWQTDVRTPPMQPHLHEGKYELDSLCALFKLSHRYFAHTRDVSCFNDGGSWTRAVSLAMDTIEEQMKGTDEEGDSPAYRFSRSARELAFKGRAAPGRRTGLSKCGFRPSDDSVKLPFLIPSNAMAVVELRHVAEVLEAMGGAAEAALAARARRIADGIDAAIQQHAVVDDPAAGGRRYNYEVDGQGGRNDMDDANIPSLLSLPYLGYAERDDPKYLKTRAFVLSKRNPWFFQGSSSSKPGSVVEGVGGPHIGRGYIWPMSIVMRGLTSTDDDEIRECLEMLKVSSAGTGLLHESFYQNDARRFTRKWFAWVNTLFGELILQLARERPHLLF